MMPIGYDSRLPMRLDRSFRERLRRLSALRLEADQPQRLGIALDQGPGGDHLRDEHPLTRAR